MSFTKEHFEVVDRSRQDHFLEANEMDRIMHIEAEMQLSKKGFAKKH